ncbi:hypothetical protein FJZ53_01540 [Candidatus Woesearchaeota archaeon]|nr:hypothetical protein [Candidatus Woesearchaeota archaeon]
MTKKSNIKKIMFVCTGNTCRSPMAEYLFKHLCKKEKLKLGIVSRGTKIGVQEGINVEAAESLKRYSPEIDTAEHLSKPVSMYDLISSDMIFVMEPKHRKQVLEHVKHQNDLLTEKVEKKVFLLKSLKGESEGRVKDPYNLIITPPYYAYEFLRCRLTSPDLKQTLERVKTILAPVRYWPDFWPFKGYKRWAYDSCRDEILESLEVLLKHFKP